MGVTLALPLLDSMIPAGTPTREDGGAAQEPLLRHLRPARRDDGQVDAGDGGQRLRVHRHAEAAREAPRSRHRRQQPGASAGRRQRIRRRRRSRAFRRGVPERRASREGHACTAAGPIDQVLADHIGQDTPLPSIEVCIEEVALNCGAGYGCSYYNTISWRTDYAAAADGEQPTGGLRAAVRRRHERGAAPRAKAAGPQHPRLGDRQGGAPAGRARRRRPRAPRRVSRQRPRNRAPHSEGGAAVGQQRPTCPKRPSACRKPSRITSS